MMKPGERLPVLILPAGATVPNGPGTVVVRQRGVTRLGQRPPSDDDAVEVIDMPRGPGPGHAAGCTCCRPRAAVAAALHRLFLRRARGEVPFFTRVVVAADDPRAAAEALADPLVSGRFVLSGSEPGFRGAFRCDG